MDLKTRGREMQNKITKSIKYIDVQEWLDKNVNNKSQTKGANSAVANGPYQEYELDLLCINHLPDQNYKMATLCIDAFTK